MAEYALMVEWSDGAVNDTADDTLTLPSPCCSAPLVDEDEAFLVCDACGEYTTIKRTVSA